MEIPESFLRPGGYIGAMIKSDPHSKYISFLLRIWSDKEGMRSIWRASLENTQTGEKVGFATPKLLLDYLLEITANGEKLNLKICGGSTREE